MKSHIDRSSSNNSIVLNAGSELGGNYCFACGFDMKGYAFLCKNDNRSQPKPCFGQFHAKKDTV